MRHGILVAFLVLGGGWSAVAQDIGYERPVEVAPTPDDIGDDYQLPPFQQPQPRAWWWEVVDLAILAGAMGAVAWLVHSRRRRRGVVLLTIFCLGWFGFWREGCVCPIGSIQNVAAGLTDPGFVVPGVVILFFFLPLVFALLFGRVFCGGVCPLGAIQELVVIKGLHVPRRLDRVLGWFPYVYLVLAVVFAIRPAETRDFVICRFDPFVGLFRMAGPAWILMVGGGLLLLGTVIGRPYCRYLCPYGALLGILSRLSWRKVTITPDQELDCGLCVEACPYGAIEKMRALPADCVACARCFRACPRDAPALEQPNETVGAAP